MVKIIETDRRMVAARGFEGGEYGELLFNMYIEFQFYKIKRILELDGDDGCITMLM